MEAVLVIAVIYVLYNFKSIKEKHKKRSENKYQRDIRNADMQEELLRKDKKNLELQKENKMLEAEIEQIERLKNE